MRIISRPRRLTMFALLALVSVGLCILNLWVMTKGAHLNRMRFSIHEWTTQIILAQACWALISCFWIFHAKMQGFWSICAMSLVCFLGNFYFLGHTKNYALAFYALFLFILTVFYLVSLYRTLHEVYYRSGRRWFEGLPRFIPAVDAKLTSDNHSTKVQLSQFTTEGVFAFWPDELRKPKSILLKYGDLSAECAVELISKTNDGLGCGLRFKPASMDQAKDIRDFFDCVRTGGYVS